MRSLAGILLSPVGLAPVTASVEAFHAAVRAAAAPDAVRRDARPRRRPARARAPRRRSSRRPAGPQTRPTLLFLHGKGGVRRRVDGGRGAGPAASASTSSSPSCAATRPRRARGSRTASARRATSSASSTSPRSASASRAARLGIDGCSMGALLALHLAAARTPAALWLQSPFGDLVAMAVHYLHRATGLPARPPRAARARPRAPDRSGPKASTSRRPTRSAPRGA